MFYLIVECNVLPAVYSFVLGMSFQRWECPSSFLFYRAGNVLPAVYSFVLGMSFQLSPV
jgi:hypothetical protein